ncbi:hypothetical protein OKW41_001694 [Paraburkholderia sp. UCT70]|uniref:hypothetical protein n=1 Tax=Paraburkholderia sp. UCT70 TaxID=2991068 RepID=UPI003D228DC9
MNSEGLSADLPVDWTDEESEFFMRAVEAIALAYKEQTITLEEAGDRICMSLPPKNESLAECVNSSKERKR